MRKSLLVLTALIPICFGTVTIAEAKPSITFHFGVPYYGYNMGPDYRFYPGRGWYRDRNWNRNRVTQRISCQRARNILSNNGYRNISTRECNGPTYTFRGKRNGNTVVLYVNARTGRFWRG